MRFYEISDVGAVSSENMRRWQKKHGILLSCTEQEAQFAEYEGTLYHAPWMVPVRGCPLSYVLTDVVEKGG